MPIVDLNSRAQVVILAARRELQPAAGERERLEELLDALIGAGAIATWPRWDHALSRSPDRVR